ncbi:MAG: branched-chain amino acid ABC transporter permease [Cellulosilyticum sp.]|nr:branched-chain amino acid ABC transporter permease [Cellulosilyticum sp.]
MEKQVKALKAALPHTIPVITGFLCLGVAYGVLMSANGYGAIWSFLMSLIAFCGSMQFVAIGLLCVSFDPVHAFIMALMVNARHLFYGLSLLKKYSGKGKLKFFLIYWLCDETFSINCSTTPPEGVDEGWFYFFISLINYLVWAFSSLLGGLLGNFIMFNTEGIDFALTALFVVIFLDGWKEQKNRIPALIGVGCSIVSIMIFGTENFIIPAMCMLLVVLTIGRGKLEGEKKACIYLQKKQSLSS